MKNPFGISFSAGRAHGPPTRKYHVAEKPVSKMDNVSDTLFASKRLRALGKAQEALRTVKTLSNRSLTSQEKREIAAEKFDILYAQGFCRAAETVLRKAIAVSSRELSQRKSEEEIWMHVVLKAKRVLIMLHTTGKMDHLMRMRRELVEMFLERYHGPRNAVLVILSNTDAEFRSNLNVYVLKS